MNEFIHSSLIWGGLHIEPDNKFNNNKKTQPPWKEVKGF